MSKLLGMRASSYTVVILLLAAAQIGQAKVTAPRLDAINVSVVRTQQGRLLVGTTDGGLAVYDAFTKKPILWSKGQAGRAKTKDAVWEAGQAWWITEDGKNLYCATPSATKPTSTYTAALGLSQPATRLGLWQSQVTLHSLHETRFVEPYSRKAKSIDQALPASVAQIAKQGTIISYWQEKKGILVAIRRYGERAEVEEGRKKDISAFTAWYATGTTRNYRKLGNYTASLSDLKDAPGPRVKYPTLNPPRDLPFGAGSVANIDVGPDGIVALDYDSAMVVPFRFDQWNKESIKTEVAPKYSSTLAYNGGNVWWVEGNEIYCASLEDGSVDVYLPQRDIDRPISVAADEGGAWIVTRKGVRRLDPGQEGDTGFGGYARAAAGDEPIYTTDQQKLANVIGEAKPRRFGTTMQFVQDTFKAAGVFLPDEFRINMEKRPQHVVKGELRYGDLVIRDGKAGIYVGDGEVASSQGGALVKWRVALGDGIRVLRYAQTVPIETAFVRLPPPPPIVDSRPPSYPNATFSGGNLSRLPWRAVPVGINRPNYSLGHDRYVRSVPGSPTDGPHKPEHFQMLENAKTYLGTRYVRGGNDYNGIDCSGFVCAVYRHMGIRLPRHSQDIGQVGFGEVVLDELKFGDVLVFPYPKHVAIYIGNNRTMETVSGGVGYSTILRRDRAVVRRFLQ